MARGTGGCVRVAQGLGARLSRGQGHQVVHAPTGAPPTLRLPVAGVVTDLFDISRCAINPPAPRDRGHRAPYVAGYRPPGVLLIAAELVDPRRDVSAAWEHWSRPDAGQGRPASFFALRELVGRSPSGCCASECPSHGVVLLDNAGAA